MPAFGPARRTVAAVSLALETGELTNAALVNSGQIAEQMRENISKTPRHAQLFHPHATRKLDDGSLARIARHMHVFHEQPKINLCQK